MKARGKVAFTALGCAKNTVDLQVMAGHLLRAGYEIVNEEDADVLVVNTCAFIESAREEAAAEIIRACELKRAGGISRVVVSGCFAQRYGHLVSGIPEFSDVDVWLGVDELDRIVEMLERKSRVFRSPLPSPCRVFNPPVPALRFNAPAYAFLKIAEGCVHRCSYCAIPLIRGAYRSRRMADVLSEARALLKSGAKELNVIAQDPMLYGSDFKDGTDLVSLLERLDALKGDFWIRVLYAYPSEITDRFLSWLRNSRHAVRYLDVPIQHTHPAVLAAMNRAATVECVPSLVECIRAAVPDVVLRTTVMTGFPGETAPRFRSMLAELERMRFDHLGVFAYSPEEGTKGFDLPRRPAAATAEERRFAVEELQSRIVDRRMKKMIGREYRALVVSPGVARLESQAPDVDGVVRIDPSVPSGSFISVRLSSRRGYDFKGVVK